jgi:transcriptional regulator with XRE-family HTH domain
MNGEQCRAARALLGLSQPALAKLAAVGENQLRQFESGKRVPGRGSIQKLRGALAVRGIEFISDSDGFGLKVNPRATAEPKGESLSLLDHEIKPKLELEFAAVNDLHPAQCRAARGFLKWSQAEAAAQLGVGLSLLISFENGRRPQRKNLDKIKAAFECSGVSFHRSGARLSVSMDNPATDLPG